MLTCKGGAFEYDSYWYVNMTILSVSSVLGVVHGTEVLIESNPLYGVSTVGIENRTCTKRSYLSLV
jgi:hypothetical protein